MVFERSANTDRIAAVLRQILLSGCLSLAAGCTPEPEFRTTGSGEESGAAGEAIRVGAANENLLDVGAIAPDFRVRSAAGEPVQLSEVLAANRLVLVDFWASWCAPCIKQFPALKDLRSRYRDRGFEIVGVSLDHAEEDWRQSSAENGLPWVNLGDQLAFSSPAAIRFGVMHLPRSFLLDANRRILARDLHPAALEGALTRRLIAGD